MILNSLKYRNNYYMNFIFRFCMSTVKTEPKYVCKNFSRTNFKSNNHALFSYCFRRDSQSACFIMKMQKTCLFFPILINIMYCTLNLFSLANTVGKCGLFF